MKYRGCVMEIRKNTMVIMTDECSFHEVKKHFNAIEGMEVEFTSRDIVVNRYSGYKSLVSIAAAVIFILITSLSLITYWQFNLKPVMLLTIDINPSIEIEVNGKQQILSITPLNNEGSQIVANIEYKRRNVEDVIELIVQRADDAGYIKDDEDNFILITTVALKDKVKMNEESQQILDTLKVSVEKMATSKGEQITVVTAEASEELYKKAKTEKISVGKIYLNENTEEDEGEVATKELKVKPLKAILEGVAKEHPVFQQNPGLVNHPLYKLRAEDKETIITDTKDKNDKNDKNDKEQREHPVFQQNPGNGNQGNGAEKDEKDPKDKDKIEEDKAPNENNNKSAEDKDKEDKDKEDKDIEEEENREADKDKGKDKDTGTDKNKDKGNEGEKGNSNNSNNGNNSSGGR